MWEFNEPMTGQGKYNPYLIGKSYDDLVQRYGTAGQLPSNQLVINPNYSHAKDRGFDLAVKKQVKSARTNESSGWIIKNRFSGLYQLHNYGILFPMMLSGAVRYETDKDGKIFQFQEHTIECETLKDDVTFDIFFSWDGMFGTNSQEGWANFSTCLTMNYDQETKILSKMDGISYLGAKTCNGSSKLTDNFVKKSGTPVTFVIRYEMDLAATSNPMSVSELHFRNPATNFFKIVTR